MFSNEIMNTPDAWVYRIEGGQKMVFSHTSTHYNYNKRQVLCLYSNKKSLPNFLQQPLFSKHLSPYLMSVTAHGLSTRFARQLVQSAQSSRPSSRPRAYTPHSVGTLYPDAAYYFGSSTIMVEIKPKCSVLSKSKLTPPAIASALNKFSTPTYHIKNYLMETGALPKRPYEPSDLLTGNLSRKRQALSALISERSRALRVFVNGRIVDPTTERPSVMAAAHALTDDVRACAGVQAIQEYGYIDTFGALAAWTRCLHREGRVKTEQLIKFELCKSPRQHRTLNQMANIRQMLTYQSRQQAIRLHTEHEHKAAVQNVNELQTRSLVTMLAHFLQAATANDCSFLISMCRVNELQNHHRHHHHGNDVKVVTVDGVDWLYRIWVIDVAEKDMIKIADKWPSEERERASKLGGTTDIN